MFSWGTEIDQWDKIKIISEYLTNFFPVVPFYTPQKQ